MHNEKISVLIPTYNRAVLLQRSIRSIQFQTHKNLDILVYDDGSTDNTNKIIEKMMENDNRIYYFRAKNNEGVSHARNELMAMCKTKYAVLQDSDDISNIYRIQLLYTKIIELGIPVVNSCFTSLPSHEFLEWRLQPNYVSEKWKWANRGGGATVMFQLDKAFEFDEKLVKGEDTNWRDRMNDYYGREFLIKKILYFVNFSSNDRLSARRRR